MGRYGIGIACSDDDSELTPNSSLKKKKKRKSVSPSGISSKFSNSTKGKFSNGTGTNNMKYSSGAKIDVVEQGRNRFNSDGSLNKNSLSNVNSSAKSNATPKIPGIESAN